MRIPVAAIPRPRNAGRSATRMVRPSGCGVIQGMKCAGEGAALVAGPCDPLGMPEDLPVCLPAAAAYLGSCQDCVKAAVKKPICAAAKLASQHGINVPSVIRNFCS